MRHKRPWPGAWFSAALLLACLPFSQLLIAQPEFESGSQPFSHRWLQTHARDMASEPFAPQYMAQDNPLRSLSYDDYRRIVFDPDAAIWSDQPSPFQLQLFHPGFLHTTPAGLHLVRDGTARRVAFSTGLFNYHDSPLATEQLAAEGYAGFRVHHPINRPDRYEEFLVFLGASYFRAVGKDQFYGLSARGLAVNTVGEGDEEFPRFSDFWIEQPEPGSDQVIIYALLDSPSVTGAYRFAVVPGEPTLIEVDAALYPRRDRARVGIAPLTSMFFFNTSNRAGHDDFRNAVHDSDGLQILQANGERIWRPLANPARVEVSSFEAGGAMPVGFGLLQRRSEFHQFNDAEARYDKRPSLWIEPLDDWGEGHIELLEIPTNGEYQDNIVAYWQPASGLSVGEEYRFRYRMHWGDDSPFATKPGRVINTSAGKALGSDERLFVIDFSDGERIASLSADAEAVRINAVTSAGHITSVSGTLIEATRQYRAYVKLDPGQTTLAELRVALEVNGQPWGETWLYRWTQ
ncbi:glucan biosynthesis protein [Saccharospirillum impatiens]|uniref:glucan biosynthesis protein n=1 Tax=Saccharospirillum impatiens TaxID=169438 RepID=UPI000423776D|nr:glucan biosynthesis protein [Saccharospirillum impatiens]